MKCEDVLLTLEEFVDGELEPKAAEQTQSHLSTCAPCRSVCEDFRADQALFAKYDRGFDVPPTMWQAIEAQIKITPLVVEPKPTFFEKISHWFGETFRTPQFSPALALALIMLTAGITYILVKPNPGQNQGNPGNEMGGPTKIFPVGDSDGQIASDPNPIKPEDVQPATDAVPSPARNVTVKAPVKRQPTPTELVREAESKYVAAILMLQRDVKKQRDNLDPVVIARLETALGAVDKTIAETREVARKNPSDPVAVQYMLASYGKKVEILREMTNAPMKAEKEETKDEPFPRS